MVFPKNPEIFEVMSFLGKLVALTLASNSPSPCHTPLHSTPKRNMCESSKRTPMDWSSLNSPLASPNCSLSCSWHRRHLMSFAACTPSSQLRVGCQHRTTTQNMNGTGVCTQPASSNSVMTARPEQDLPPGNNPEETPLNAYRPSNCQHRAASADF